MKHINKILISALKFRYLISLAVILFDVSMNAQVTEDVLLKQINLQQILNARSSINITQCQANAAIISQAGDGNSANVSQASIGILKSSNLVFINQTDSYNKAGINQTGVENSILVHQQGSYNDLELNMMGSYNQSVLVQTGLNNEIISDMNADGICYKVTQEGVDNKLVQKEEAAPKLNYTITQMGKAMNIIITNGAVK